MDEKTRKQHNLLKLVSSFCETDDFRPNLQGIYFCDDKKTAVATDGYRMIASKNLFDPNFSGLIINPITLKVIDADYPKWETVFPLDNVLSKDKFRKLIVPKGLKIRYASNKRFVLVADNGVSELRELDDVEVNENYQPEFCYSGKNLWPLFAMFGGSDHVTVCEFHSGGPPAIVIDAPQCRMLFVAAKNGLHRG